MSLRFLKISLQKQVLMLALVTMALIWGATFYEIQRSQASEIHEAGVRTSMDARMFGEYSETTFKRINELLLNLRRAWHGNWQEFATAVQSSQDSIQDISFQVSIIDRDGWLAFSNLTQINHRVDLREREHFQVHKNAPHQDQLYISQPVFGKVSGKWSIQFTRPIFRNGEFDGVLVVSVSPSFFDDFAASMAVEQPTVISMVRMSGEIMTQYPALMSQTLVQSGETSDRVNGYYKLPEYGIMFVAEQNLRDVLAHVESFKRGMLGAATAFTLLIGVLLWALMRSIADGERLKRDLLQSKQLAETANMAKSQFLATMSHELRTPLNAVQGMAQLLSFPQVSDDNRIRFSQTILNSAKALTLLLTDLLDMSQIQVNKLVLRPAPCDVATITHDVTRLFTQSAASKNLDLKDSWEGPEGRYYWVDPIRLRQMLSNLISNAIKFTDHGFVHVVAREFPQKDTKKWLEFSVQDSGIGVAKDKQDLLFQRFSQVDSSFTRASDGAGLGLSIVQGLAERMGGTAGVDSQPMMGSRFWFRIPAGGVELDATSEEASVSISGDVAQQPSR